MCVCVIPISEARPGLVCDAPYEPHSVDSRFFFCAICYSDAQHVQEFNSRIICLCNETLDALDAFNLAIMFGWIYWHLSSLLKRRLGERESGLYIGLLPIRGMFISFQWHPPVERHLAVDLPAHFTSLIRHCPPSVWVFFVLCAQRGSTTRAYCV